MRPCIIKIILRDGRTVSHSVDYWAINLPVGSLELMAYGILAKNNIDPTQHTAVVFVDQRQPFTIHKKD